MDGEDKKYVTVGRASQLTGISAQTIRKMADNASIPCYRTPTGQRRISVQGLQAMCDGTSAVSEEPEVQKTNYLYTRVSTKEQLDDLSRQLEFLQRPEYSDYTVIQDVGSGINFKRKGIKTLLDSCLQGTLGEVVIAHRDRLCRFGFEIFEYLVSRAGGKITVLDDSQDKSCEQELTEDLLSIIQHMGKRSYSTRKTKNRSSEDISDSLSEEEVE
jgi:putative resolvase